MKTLLDASIGVALIGAESSREKPWAERKMWPPPAGKNIHHF